MINKEKVLWFLFYLDLLVIIAYLVGASVGQDFSSSGLIGLLVLTVPVLLVTLHAFWTLSPTRALIFFILASGIGLVSEIFGLTYGVFFGGQYVYRSFGPALFGVPLAVVLYWSVFIYTGYCLVTSSLYWLNRSKPNIANKNFWLLLLLVPADGLVVLAIDLFMDPLQVRDGSWTWLAGGPYFGVPVGNFVGWFIVAATSTGVFRVYEYLFPAKKINIGKTVFLIPVIGYALLAVSFGFSAINYKMYNLAAIGLLLMIPVSVVNVILYRLWASRYSRHGTRHGD